MADNSEEILKKLQQHSMPPPPAAFEKAWEAATVRKKDPSPAIEKQVFGKLQDYKLEPPAMDFKSVLQAKKEADKKSVFGLSKVFLRAAAVLLVAAAGIGIYLTVQHNNNSAPLSYTKPKQDTETGKSHQTNQNSTTADITKKEGGINSANNNAADKASAAVPPKKISRGTAPSNRTRPGEKYKNAGNMEWSSNDMFFTLVNYKEYGKEKLFVKSMADKTVVLNKYSYVNISDKMAGMLQEVYLTKKNGKPARKAKKAKKKFDKWREKDENYFDKNIDKNPVDIIDLSNFVMDN